MKKMFTVWSLPLVVDVDILVEVDANYTVCSFGTRSHDVSRSPRHRPRLTRRPPPPCPPNHAVAKLEAETRRSRRARRRAVLLGGARAPKRSGEEPARWSSCARKGTRGATTCRRATAVTSPPSSHLHNEGDYLAARTSARTPRHDAGVDRRRCSASPPRTPSAGTVCRHGRCQARVPVFGGVTALSPAKRRHGNERDASIRGANAAIDDAIGRANDAFAAAYIYHPGTE